jgi:hypothetical protein
MLKKIKGQTTKKVRDRFIKKTRDAEITLGRGAVDGAEWAGLFRVLMKKGLLTEKEVLDEASEYLDETIAEVRERQRELEAKLRAEMAAKDEL